MDDLFVQQMMVNKAIIEGKDPRSVEVNNLDIEKYLETC